MLAMFGTLAENGEIALERELKDVNEHFLTESGQLEMEVLCRQEILSWKNITKLHFNKKRKDGLNYPQAAHDRDSKRIAHSIQVEVFISNA